MPDFKTDPRIDPEMRAAQQARDAAAARHPPALIAPPYDEHRRISDLLGQPYAQGGPTMAYSADHWVYARGRRVLCRVHKPRLDETLPVIVYMHGGGWVFSSVDTHDRVIRELAMGADAAIVSIDYTLSPEAPFPQALEECVGVIRWIAAHGQEWGIDPARITLAGDSAGANLALACALLLRDTHGPACQGIAALYPVTDADFTTPSYAEFAQGYGLSTQAMRDFWQCYAPDTPSRLSPYASPMRADPSGLPPVLVQLAELDVLYSEGAALAERWALRGVNVTCQTVPGLLHGYARATQSVSRAAQALQEAGLWLHHVLSAT